MRAPRRAGGGSREQAGKFSRALQDREEISITVTGRRTRKAITLPVWFAAEGDTLWLLPVTGSTSQWYRNVRAHPEITIRAGRQRMIGRARPVSDPKIVRAVVRRFQAKYTPPEIARYYSRFDAAVRVPLKP